MAVPISGTATLEVGTPVPLFNARLTRRPGDRHRLPGSVQRTADGQRFLLNVPVDETPDFPAITVVLNWTAGLRK